MRRVSRYEARVGVWLTHAPTGIPRPELEYAFAKEAMGRKWRLDFAWPDYKVGVEVDGGGRKAMLQRNPRTGHMQPVAVGRHGSAADYEKLNAAAELGWRVLRFNPDMLKRPDMLVIVERTLRAAGWTGSRSLSPPAPPLEPPQPR